MREVLRRMGVVAGVVLLSLARSVAGPDEGKSGDPTFRAKMQSEDPEVRKAVWADIRDAVAYIAKRLTLASDAGSTWKPARSVDMGMPPDAASAAYVEPIGRMGTVLEQFFDEKRLADRIEDLCAVVREGGLPQRTEATEVLGLLACGTRAAWLACRSQSLLAPVYEQDPYVPFDLVKVATYPELEAALHRMDGAARAGLALALADAHPEPRRAAAAAWVHLASLAAAGFRYQGHYSSPVRRHIHVGGRQHELDGLLPPLERALADEDLEVRRGIARAWRSLVGVVGVDDQGVLAARSALRAALRGDDPQTLADLAWVLDAMGPPATLSLEEAELLSAYCASPIVELRRLASAWLAAAPRLEPDVITRLLVAAKDGDPRVRAAATTALGRAGESDARVDDALQATLEDDEHAVVLAGLRAIAARQRVRPEALHRIASHLGHRVESVRTEAGTALVRLAAGMPEVLDAVRVILRGDDPTAREGAVRVLAEAAIDIAAARDELTAAFPSVTASGYVVQALVKLGPSVVPSMLASLRHESPEVRSRAVEVLGHFGGASEQVFPALLAALRDPQHAVSDAAAKALAKVGDVSEGTLFALFDALGDETEHVRRATFVALQALADVDMDALLAARNAASGRRAELASEALARIQGK